MNIDRREIFPLSVAHASREGQQGVQVGKGGGSRGRQRKAQMRTELGRHMANALNKLSGGMSGTCVKNRS